MIEAAVASAIAMVAGVYTIFQGLHKRITVLDTKLDRIELDLARDFVPRTEFVASQAKLEAHMVRIEEKLDRMLERYRPS